MNNGGRVARSAGQPAESPPASSKVKDAKQEILENNQQRETRFKTSVGLLTGFFGLLL